MQGASRRTVAGPIREVHAMTSALDMRAAILSFFNVNAGQDAVHQFLECVN